MRRATLRAWRVRLGSLAALVLCAAPLQAQQTAPPPIAPAPASPAAAPAAPPPEAVVAPPTAPAAVAAPAVAPPAAETGAGVGPIPTSDETPAPSDHDAVVGHVGVAARRLDPGPLPLALRPGQGCTTNTPCTVTLGAVGARYWMNRNLALNGYLVLGTGGGSVAGQDLDTYFGVGPIVGMTLLLANWKHLAIGASPELAVVWFRPAGGDAASTTLFQVRGAIEGELHFGFIGIPALSIGLQAGAQVLYEHAPAGHLWSVGVVGAGSIWDALSTLYVRYYL